MFGLLNVAGFSSVQIGKYFVQPDLQDYFLYVHKYRPEQYMDPAVRKGTSGFVLCCKPEEIKRGLKELEADITSGDIQYIISKYEDEKGDYLSYHAVK